MAGHPPCPHSVVAGLGWPSSSYSHPSVVASSSQRQHSWPTISLSSNPSVVASSSQWQNSWLAIVLVLIALGQVVTGHPHHPPNQALWPHPSRRILRFLFLPWYPSAPCAIIQLFPQHPSTSSRSIQSFPALLY